MRVLITGATGFTGREVVRAALSAGMEVTALTRNPSRFTQPPNVKVASVDFSKGRELEALVAGHDAVLHCLGVGGTGTGKATTVVSDATAQLVPAMKRSGVTRLVALSNVGAGSSVNQGSWLYRRVIRPIVSRLFLRWLAPIIDDKNRMEPIITSSTLDWTIVRLPNVIDRPRRHSLRLSTGTAAVGLSIGNADLAEFLVASLTTPALTRTAVSASN